ncbi:MAG TPA: hypothetical protein VL068_06090 [Microthrixaceae bacterium]|nr:hypothetical protein [Microthrixaceae bacterium]
MGGLIRAMLALALGLLVSLGVRLIGGPAVAPKGGGWRELSGPDLR